MARHRIREGMVYTDNATGCDWAVTVVSRRRTPDDIDTVIVRRVGSNETKRIALHELENSDITEKEV